MRDLRKTLTVLVNSTDTFDDCWQAFFALFARAWPDCGCAVLLNTETRQYVDPVVQLSCTRTQAGDPPGTPRLPWADCLIRCLDQVGTPYVLYLQEDYFLNGQVDTGFIDQCLEVMERHLVPHVRLMEVDERARYQPSALHPQLWQIDQFANYRISLQAGLWEVQALRRLLRPGESAWEFERHGSLRSMAEPALFLCQSLQHFNAQGRYPVPYKPTGIIKGRWYAPAVVDLFAAHGISVDFRRRGFYSESLARRITVPARAFARRLAMGALAVAIGARK